MAGVTVLRNRSYVYVYSTISYRDKDKKPKNHRKAFAIVQIGTNRIVFNSYGMAILKAQNIELESLNNKSLSDIGKIVDFSRDLDYSLYRSREINYSNSIEVSDDLISRFPKITIKNHKNYFNTGKTIITDKSSRTNMGDIEHINIKSCHSNEDKVVKRWPDFNHALLNFGSSDKAEICIKPDICIKSYGTQVLLENISNAIGLTKIIGDVFPKNWQEILTLSFYMCVNNNSLDHCQNWVENNDCFVRGSNLSPQKISDLLYDITLEERTNFYNNWAKSRNDSKFLAFDIRSIPIFSNRNFDLTYNYDREIEKLRQINLGLLFGIDSRLPVYPTSCSENISYLNFFRDIINNCGASRNINNYEVVLDKEFYGKRNINTLLYNDKLKFIISVPIQTAFIKNYIREFKEKFNDNYIFCLGNDILYGTTTHYDWDNKTRLYLHIYFNENSYNIAKRDVQAAMIMLKEEALNNPTLDKNIPSHTKYLRYKPKADNPELYDISLNLDQVADLYKDKGWFFILSNEISDYQQALTIYKQKEILEKEIFRLIHNCDLSSLKIQSDNISENKLLIAFISFILFSSIHNTMEKENLYPQYTQQSLFEKLNSLQFVCSDNVYTLKPISKACIDIYNSFNIKID